MNKNIGTQALFHAKSLITWMILCVFCTYANSKTILLLPHLQGSHVFEITTIGEQLVKNGHDVYCVIPKGSKHTPLLQMKGISVLTFAADNSELMDSDAIIGKSNEAIFLEGDRKDDIRGIFTRAADAHCQYMMNDLGFINKVKNKQFDLAIVDGFFIGPCLFLLPHNLSIPYVAAAPSLRHWDIGVPFLPSFMYGGSQLDHQGTFWDKMTSLGFMLLWNSPFSPFKRNMNLIHEYAPDVESYIVLVKAAKLFVITRDYILDIPGPSMPNVIHVPGCSYKPAQLLPASLSAKIPKDKHIILFSFGSTASNMPSKTIQRFLEAFARFPDYVLVWKLPKTNGVILPKNVITLPWLPQNDILGHNQTVLIITHCGANSLYESFYHGVPSIGFPLFAEQHHNAKMITTKGYGLSLDIKTFTVNQLVSAMREILHSNVYQNRLIKVSSMLHERAPPKEEIAFWIEHVMKYGDDHIRPVSIDMPLYELYIVDILAMFLVCIVIMGIVFITFIRCLLANMCHKSNQHILKSE